MKGKENWMNRLKYKTIVELVYKEGDFGPYLYGLHSYGDFGIKLVHGLILRRFEQRLTYEYLWFYFHEFLTVNFL